MLIESIEQQIMDGVLPPGPIELSRGQYDRLVRELKNDISGRWFGHGPGPVRAVFDREIRVIE